MSLEINKELVVSTAHITKDTDSWLTHAEVNSNPLLSIDPQECGYRIYIESDDECFRDTYAELWKQGRGELAELMKLAKNYYCKWLVIDCDGPRLSFRPQFEW